MGTVSQEAECQRCDYEHGYHEFQTRTMEDYFMCPRCGHQVRYVVDNWDDSKYKSGKKEGQKRKTWKPKYRTETIVPVASYTLKEKGALGKQLGPVPTETDLINFKENVSKRVDELSIAKLTYMCAEGEYLGKWVTEDLLENKVELINK